MLNDEDTDMQFGSAYILSEHDEEPVGRSFILQRGVLVPKDYQRAKTPIGFVWDDL